MLIYYCIVAILFILGLMRKGGNMSGKQFCFVAGTIFALVTGLRNSSVGSDTDVYYISYLGLDKYSSVWDTLYDHGDIAYYILAWTYAHLHLPFWCLTLTVGIFFYYCVSSLIYKYSSDCLLSYLILMAFNFFQFSMTGVRQTIAIGFVLLALVEAFKHHYKLKKIFWLILAGYLFHNSCAVFLLILPMLYFRTKVSDRTVVLSVVLLLIGFMLRTQLMELMLMISEDSRFKYYGIMEETGGGLTTYLLLFAIYLTMLYNRRTYVLNNRRGTLDIWLLFFSVLFQGTVLVQSVMFRIAWYFEISLIIILPGLLHAVNKENRKLATMLVYFGVLFMYLKITMASANVVPYKFFWQ